MTAQSIATDTLRRFSVLDGLTDEEMDRLKPILASVSLDSGEVLLKEGDDSDEIYLIISGRVDICKTGKSQNECFVIASADEGAVFGELAFLDGSPRSAMVRATTETSLLVIEKTKLFQLPFSHKVVANIARASSEKLRETASSYVGSLEAQVASIRTQNEFGQFFIYILSLMAIGMIVNNLLHTYLSSVSPYSMTFFISYTLTLLVPSLIIVWKLKMPLRSMGATLTNWKRSLIEGIVISAILIAVFTVAGAVAGHFNWMTVKPITLSSLFNPWYMHPIYFFHSFAQELFRGGFLQTAFERFFNDRTGVRSIGFTALLFGLFHIHFGILAVAVTFFSSILFGIIYRRHRNLIGVTIVHYAAGVWAFASGVL